MKHLSLAIAVSIVGLATATGAQAQTAGNLLGAPLIAGGGLLSSASAGHAQIAPTVNNISPTAEPITDTVTNVLGVAGGGVTNAGNGIQANGVLVGSSSSGKPLVSVGASAPASQGSLAALLNGHH